MGHLTGIVLAMDLGTEDMVLDMGTTSAKDRPRQNLNLIQNPGTLPLCIHLMGIVLAMVLGTEDLDMGTTSARDQPRQSLNLIQNPGTLPMDMADMADMGLGMDTVLDIVV